MAEKYPDKVKRAATMPLFKRGTMQILQKVRNPLILDVGLADELCPTQISELGQRTDAMIFFSAHLGYHPKNDTQYADLHYATQTYRQHCDEDVQRAATICQVAATRYRDVLFAENAKEYKSLQKVNQQLKVAQQKADEELVVKDQLIEAQGVELIRVRKELERVRREGLAHSDAEF